jgi:hypothetical protein
LTAVKRSSSTKAKKTVTIRASDIAAIIGRNYFKKPNVVFDEMWKKHFPDTFLGQTKEDIAFEAVERASPEEKLILETTASYQAKDSIDATTKFAQAKKLIESSVTMTEIDKSTLIDHVKSQVFTSHGIRAESKTADLIEEKEGIVLAIDNKFYNYPLCEIDGVKYRISGKIDRLERVGDDIIIVEIKNRMSKIYTTAPDYEFIQVQTYMQIVPLNVTRAKLIQQYQSETNTLIVERDDQVWRDEILAPLLKFCAEFQRLTRPPVESPLEPIE